MADRDQLLKEKAAELETKVKQLAVEVLGLGSDEHLHVTVRITVRSSPPSLPREPLPPWPISDKMTAKDWEKMLGDWLPPKLREVVEALKRRGNQEIPAKELGLTPFFSATIGQLNSALRTARLPYRLLSPEGLEIRRSQGLKVNVWGERDSIKLFKPDPEKLKSKSAQLPWN